jgi:3'-phosphoadenosine 5'-phosphosulfate (PAPS) 3'-phosphatase
VTYRSFGRYDGEMQAAIAAAERAAQIVMDLRGRASSKAKADGSIVTDADFAAADSIRTDLAAAFPEDGILTEEDAQETDRLTRNRVWIVDPIDGTAQYASGSDDFDIYIALSVAGRIAVGVSLQPATGLLVVAAEGEGSAIREDGRWSNLAFRTTQSSAPVIGTRPWLGSPDNLPDLKRIATALGGTVRDPDRPIGVRSFLGDLDLAVALYRNGRTPDGYEWDLAVLDIVLRESGGAAVDLQGQPLRFNKPVPWFPDGLLLTRRSDLIERTLAALSA